MPSVHSRFSGRLLTCIRLVRYVDFGSRSAICKHMQDFSFDDLVQARQFRPDPRLQSRVAIHGGEYIVDVSGDPSWPAEISCGERVAMLAKYLEFHRPTFRRAIWSLRFSLLRKHLRDLDPDTQVVVFTLGHRPPSVCDGNPATRLYIKRTEVSRWDQFANVEDGQRMRRAIVDRADSLDPYAMELDTGDITGFLKIAFLAVGASSVAILPLRRITPEEVAAQDPRCENWFEDLTFLTAAGIRFSDAQGHDDYVGRVMRRKGRKWRWAEMETEDAMRIRTQVDAYKRMGPEPEVDLCLLTDTSQ